MNGKVPPPYGYETWLDYAVEAFDARLIAAGRLFEEGAQPSSWAAEDFREAARQELRDLRSIAARVADAD